MKITGRLIEKSPTCSMKKSKTGHCTDTSVEVLKEGQECPFCHFAKMKRNEGEIICPICGYGHRAST